MKTKAGFDRWGAVTVAVCVIWIIAYIFARGMLKRDDLETWQRVAGALAPIPPFAVFLVLFILGIRSLDELQRRIHLEALAIAFPLTVVLLMVLGLLQRAIELPFQDWSYLHVWMYLPIFYFAGIAYAGRRYL